MGDIREYRFKEIVRAEKIDEAQAVNTSNGVVWANAGDYVVYSETETLVAFGADFLDKMEEISSEESAAREFVPAGKTVDDVLTFLRDNPGEVERVKTLETEGAGRKGILEF